MKSNVKPGWYHMGQMTSVQLDRDSEGSPALFIRLKEDAAPAPEASGLLYEWLYVHESGRSYLSDSCNWIHYREAAEYYVTAFTGKPQRVEPEEVLHPIVDCTERAQAFHELFGKTSKAH